MPTGCMVHLQAAEGEHGSDDAEPRPALSGILHELVDLKSPLSSAAGQALLKSLETMAPRELTITSWAQELHQVCGVTVLGTWRTWLHTLPQGACGVSSRMCCIVQSTKPG